MDPLPPAIQARLARLGSMANAPRARAAGERSHPSDSALDSERTDHRSRFSGAHPHGPDAALTARRLDVTGAFDTPVDPLQLIWLVARDREDFVNF